MGKFSTLEVRDAVNVVLDKKLEQPNYTVYGFTA